MCEIAFDGHCDVWRETPRMAPNREACCLPCDKDRKEFGDAHHVMLGPHSWPEYLHECIYDGGHDDESRRWLPALRRLKQRRRLAKQSK